MAFKDKKISNPVTGQDIKFLRTSKDTNGEFLEMEAIYNSNSKEPVAHYHPFQTEDFTVLSGELTVRMDGHIRVLKQGETLHIKVNKSHSMWNDTNEKVIVNWRVQPAMNTDNFLETLIGLAVEGKTNKDGMPGILQMALTANMYSNVIRISKPAFAIQKLLFIILTPISYLFGYRPIYKKYLD